MITIVGDIIVDEYLHCVISGNNPEIPTGRKLRIIDRHLILGGAAAVAKLIQSHGKHSLLASVVSTDPPGLWASSELEVQGVAKEICWDSSRQTTTKTRILIDGEVQPDRLDIETLDNISDSHSDILSNIDLGEVVLLVDYDKGVLTDQVCQRLIRKANKYFIPTIVDPAYGKPWSRYTGVSLIKANRKEASAEMARLLGNCSSFDPDVMARFLAAKHNCRVIVTDGKSGMGWSDGVDCGYVKAVKVTGDIDPTGCGDNVLVGVALKYNEPLPDACRFATSLAAKCVLRLGV